MFLQVSIKMRFCYNGVVWQKLTIVSEEVAAFLVRVPEGESCSSLKVSVTYYQTTRRHIPEDSNMQMARNEPRLICVLTFLVDNNLRMIR